MTFSRALFFFVCAGLFFSACKKPVLDGTALLPQDNLSAIFTDTLTVRTYTVREDSLLTGGGSLCPLGIMTDPLFGRTEASFYIPFTLPRTNLVLDDGPVTLDSIILTLRYNSIYGDWRDAQTIEIYEMTEGINDSVSNYSNRTFAVNPQPVATIADFIPNVTDSMTVDGIRVPPVLRIKLDNAWGQKFIDASGTSNYENNTNFRQFFKGLHVAASRVNPGKALVFFDPRSVFTDLIVYYHDEQDSADRVRFAAASLFVAGNFRHDYTGVAAAPYINNPDDTASLTFIQGLAGLNTKFTVPFLDSLGNILINKAEIELTQVINRRSDTTVFKAPNKLILTTKKDGRFVNIIDQSPASLAGGNKLVENDTATNQTVIRYRMSVARYYQQIVSGITQDEGVYILPDARFQSAARLMAGGGSHPQFSIRLLLTYTVIP